MTRPLSVFVQTFDMGVVADEDLDFETARALVPNPLPRPPWQKADFWSQ